MSCVQANEQLQARLEALRSQPSALVQAQAKQEEHVRDRDKFRTLIDNLQVCPLLLLASHAQSVWVPLQLHVLVCMQKQFLWHCAGFHPLQTCSLCFLDKATQYCVVFAYAADLMPVQHLLSAEHAASQSRKTD